MYKNIHFRKCEDGENYSTIENYRDTMDEVELFVYQNIQDLAYLR